MACNCCRSIDLVRLINGERIAHHSTFAELQVCSSAGDCRVCVWITSALKREFNLNNIRSEVYDAAEVSCDVSADVGKTHGISKVFFNVRIGASLFRKAIEFFVAKGSPLADSRMISGRPIALYANDDSCFELARKWRDVCQEEHGDSCFKSTEQTMPTRVIDVGPSNGSQDPALRITSGERGEWVALSHCWGTVSQFVTNSSNVPLSERSINLGDMPPAFRDAVIVTRQLGYRYLWIDSLCIVQDVHEDWVAESVRMRDYYKHAILTISADSSPGDHVAFLTHRREIQEYAPINLTSNHWINARQQVRDLIFRDRDTYISARAWTLQEFVLAPRSLLYTSQQIIWDCHTSKFCESDDNFEEGEENLFYRGMKRFFSTLSSARERFPEYEEFFDPSFRWYSLVSDYFYRDLTNKKDVLPAISGLAREIQNQTGKTYVAGIWIEEIHITLLWATGGRAKIPEAYQAPSWSWASLQSLPDRQTNGTPQELYLTVAFENPCLLEWRACCLSYEVILEDGDPFGCVSSGFIRIRGRFLPTRLWQGKTEPFNRSYKSDKSHYYSHLPTGLSMDQLVCDLDIIEPDIDEEDIDDEDIAKEDIDEEGIDEADIDEDNVVPRKLLDEIIMFQISAWDWGYQGRSQVIILALLLLPVKDKPADTYRRVGVVEVPTFEGLAEKCWTMKEITII